MISKHSPQTQGVKSSMFGIRKSGRSSGGWLFNVSPLLHLSCPALKQPLNALTQFFRSFGLTTLKWILWMGLAFAYLSGCWEFINGMYVIIQHHKKQWLLKQFVLVSPYSDTRRLAKIHRRQKIVLGRELLVSQESEVHSDPQRKTEKLDLDVYVTPVRKPVTKQMIIVHVC